VQPLSYGLHELIVVIVSKLGMRIHQLLCFFYREAGGSFPDDFLNEGCVHSYFHGVLEVLDLTKRVK